MRVAAGRRIARLLLALCSLALLVLVLGQIFLPGIAADRIASRLRRYGSVHRVSVSAWPAVELLWGRAGSVDVRGADLRLSLRQTASLLWEGRGVDRIQMTAASVREGGLRLTAVRLSKQGSRLSASALASEADVRAALPAGLSLKLLGSEGGRVKLRASGGLFGVPASLDAVAEAREGRLVAHPLGLLLEGVQLSLFADPHVFVQGVDAAPATLSDGAFGYRLGVQGRLR